MDVAQSCQSFWKQKVIPRRSIWSDAILPSLLELVEFCGQHFQSQSLAGGHRTLQYITKSVDTASSSARYQSLTHTAFYSSPLEAERSKAPKLSLTLTAHQKNSLGYAAMLFEKVLILSTLALEVS